MNNIARNIATLRRASFFRVPDAPKVTLMRTDENGQPCPATLGGYRDLIAVLGGEECRAVKMLDSKIADQGRDAEVIVPDSQMRGLLMSMLF